MDEQAAAPQYSFHYPTLTETDYPPVAQRKRVFIGTKEVDRKIEQLIDKLVTWDEEAQIYTLQAS